MAQTPSTDSLYTQVKNTSGAVRFFGYLGSHGKTLANNETYSQKGNLFDGLSNKPRQWSSLQTDLTEGRLEILSTPAVILQDIDTDDPRQLALDDTILGTVSPEWDEDGSSVFVPGYSA